MRTPVKLAVILAVLIVAGCTVVALLFVRSTQMRLDRLEDYLGGRRDARDSQYEQLQGDNQRQQQEIDDLEAQLCRLDPTSCAP